MLVKTFLIVFLLILSTSYSEIWRFGIMGDTQWKQNLDGENPNTVAGGIIKNINKEMIKHKVSFVVQVGDLCDIYSRDAFNTRAALAQELIDSGIGFFPLRGNHESSKDAADYFTTVFPQTTGSINTFGAINFSSPFPQLEGLSYSFDFNNGRFILLDQFTRKDGTGSVNNNIRDQIRWIDSLLRARPKGYHTFIFSHKNLIGQNHIDALLGANPSSNIALQDSFFEIASVGGVKYCFSGHDHMHHRSIVFSPSREFCLQQIITSSNSYKFYTPRSPAIDIQYNNPPREIPIVQELYTVGYYIVTVDGEWISVDYYSSLNGCGNCELTETPTLNFEGRETFGYSLNGKEFIISEDEPLTVIKDTFKVDGLYRTRMEIISGINDYYNTILDGRRTSKVINTGWKKKEEIENSDSVYSDVLRIWGLENGIGTDVGSKYVLCISCDSIKGGLAIKRRDKNGKWVEAVNSSYSKFVIGKWQPAYDFGLYGIDPVTRTAWIVLDKGGVFAVCKTDDGDLDGDGDIDNEDISILLSYRNQSAEVFPKADFDNDGKITIIDARKLVMLKNN